MRLHSLKFKISKVILRLQTYLTKICNINDVANMYWSVFYKDPIRQRMHVHHIIWLARFGQMNWYKSWYKKWEKILTSLLAITTFFPIFAFLSIMQFLHEKGHCNIKVGGWGGRERGREGEGEGGNSSFQILPDFSVLSNTNRNLSLG